MALTTYTNRTLASNFTQQQFYDEIKDAMQIAGFSAPIDENGTAGSIMEQVYSVTYNASAKGTVFLRLQISTATPFTVTPTLFDTYNLTTNVGTNASTSPFVPSVANTATLSVLTVNNPEMRGICFKSGTNEAGFVGIIRPETKPASWDENLWTYAFILNSSGANFSLRSCAAAVQPTINAASAAFIGPNVGPAGVFSTANTLTGQSDLFSWGNLIVNAGSNIPHYGGTFSNDLAIVQGSGKSQDDTFNNKWIYLGRNICHRYAL